MMDSAHKMWIWIGAAVAVVVVAVVAVVLVSNSQVAVPNVVGMPSADAVRTLEAAGFRLGVTATVVSTDTAPGTVTSETPAADSKAKKGDTVNITVTKPQDLVSVPVVTGQDSAAAAAAITAAGLAPEIHSDYSTSTPAGKVYGQVPTGGSTVLPGSQVALGVSLGPAPSAGVVVPKVTGKTQADAIDALKNAGFAVAVQEGYSSSVAAGNVIGQLPAGGAKALPGSTVGISVSQGKATSSVTVPNVAGKTKSDAIAALEAAGLNASTYDSYSSTVLQGDVIGQIPPAGSKVARGTVIGLSVSIGKAPTVIKVPNVVGMAAVDASKAIEAKNLVPVEIKQNSDTVPVGQVISQSPVAGSGVKPNTQVLYAVSTGPANKPTPQ